MWSTSTSFQTKFFVRRDDLKKKAAFISDTGVTVKTVNASM